MSDWFVSHSNTKFHHAVALVTLALVILGRWWLYLTSTAALGDEGIYLQAFHAIVNGGDPNQVSGFYYPKTFAALGAWLLRSLGEIGTKALLRTTSVVGLALTIWISACLWTAPWSWRLALSGLFVSFSPAVYFGIETGNMAFAISGAILLALTLWSVHPVSAGVLLAGSTAIKPLAPLAILALVAHRPVPSTRRQLLAGGVGGVLTSAILSMNLGYLGTLPSAIDRLPSIRSISLHRILRLLGLEASPVVIAAILGLLIVLIARRYPMTRRTMLCFGGLAAVLAVPIIWSHTLLLTLPLQVLALTRARSRRQEQLLKNSLWRRYESTLVILAVIALQLTEGAGAIDDQAMGFQFVVIGGAYLAAPVLMAYVLATDHQAHRTAPL